MGWVDELARVTHPDGRQLIGASFRGVPFFVEDSERTGGRRIARHEFIDASDPKIDDLGKKANDFRVTGYVLGDEYMGQRDQLMSALQDVAGPGDLVHPFFGHIRAQVGGVGVSESKTDGGQATFQIEFAHAPVTSSPTAAIDLKVQVRDQAERLVVVNRARLEGAAVIAGQPAYALQSLSTDLAGVSDDLNDRLSSVVLVTQELALMSQAINVLTSQSVALVRTPGVMLDNMIGATQLLVESTLNAPLEITRAIIDTYAFPRQADALGTTDARVQERINQLAYSDAIRAVLVCEAARIVTGVSFRSVEEATSTRDLIVDALDELAATAGNDTFPDIVNLRSGILKAIPGDETLARIQTIVRNTDQPSILLSYQLYGDTDSAADIVARNQSQHPAYMSGSLSVLSDV